MELVECICLTIGGIVLICVVGKCIQQHMRLSHEKEMEEQKWNNKKEWEKERAENLDKKAWFEEELGKIRKELEDIKNKIKS